MLLLHTHTSFLQFTRQLNQYITIQIFTTLHAEKHVSLSKTSHVSYWIYTVCTRQQYDSMPFSAYHFFAESTSYLQYYHDCQHTYSLISTILSCIGKVTLEKSSAWHSLNTKLHSQNFKTFTQWQNHKLIKHPLRSHIVRGTNCISKCTVQ